MDSSPVQSIKIAIVEHLPIENDLFHVVLGAMVLIVCLLLRSRARLRMSYLLPLGLAAIAGVAIEIMDLRDDLSTLGYLRWSESAKDVFLTTSVPLLYGLVERRVRGWTNSAI